MLPLMLHRSFWFNKDFESAEWVRVADYVLMDGWPKTPQGTKLR